MTNYWRCDYCGFDCKICTEKICEKCGKTRKGFEDTK